MREDALSFIYFELWDQEAAPMWRVGLNQEVNERVRVLSKSPSAQEKEAALKALAQLDLLKQKSN
ncbi:MAG: hypothetical protein WB660_05785 [Candidatus Sulfotelmatobacter sp.]